MTRPMDDTHARLTALANRLSRLRPDGRNPEPFYEERSELKAEALKLANSPTVLRTVTKYVQIQPKPMAAPAPLAEPPPGSIPLVLTPQERAVLAHAVTVTTSGFLAAFRRWNRDVNPDTGVLIIRADDVDRIWKWGSRPGKGGAQSYTKQAFWRCMGPIFAALPLVAETGDVVSKKARSRPETQQDTPHRNAPGGVQGDGRPWHADNGQANQDAPERTHEA